MENKSVCAVIITHGNFGKELLKSVEMIMGNQNDAYALGLCLDNDVSELRDEVDKIIVKEKAAGKRIILLVDLLGGSPSNIALYMAKLHEVKVITGVNILMLIELFSSREYKEFAELLSDIVKTGIDGIKQYP